MEKLNGWPVKAEKEGATFVHASLSKPLHRYLTRNKEAEEEFPLLEGELCFIGHTHMPGGFMQDVSTGKIETIFPDFGGGMKLAMDDGHRYIVNVGSVGQPRDGFPFACAAIYDKDKKLVTIHRLEYPLEKTRCKIIEKGLPSVLAKRIMQGI
jgi:diadenosine tetraphosphatase ApaH/serine/threonine PP2A family protein phosphatase